MGHSPRCDKKSPLLFKPILWCFIYHTESSFISTGIGMDTCVIPLRHGGLSLVQTTDYIYPIVDDPYMMVWDSSFMGITFCPNVVLWMSLYVCVCL